MNRPKAPTNIFNRKYRDEQLLSLPPICCREVVEQILEILITSAQLDVSNDLYVDINKLVKIPIQFCMAIGTI